jgi:hypothetical protein
MVVLGGWYLYQCDEAVHKEDRLVQVTGMWEWRTNVEVYWADVNAWGFAHQKYLTPLPDQLNPILSDSITKGERYE